MKRLLTLVMVFGLGYGTFFAGQKILFTAENSRADGIIYYDPNFGLVHQANVRIPGMETNDEGFRDVRNFSEKLSHSCGKFRIVILGASSTFGSGISFPQTLGPKLEVSLGQIGIPVSVFNLSQVANTTEWAKALAREWLPKIRPDLVLTSLGYMEAYKWTENNQFSKHFPSPLEIAGSYVHSLGKIATLAARLNSRVLVLPTLRAEDFRVSEDPHFVFVPDAEKAISALSRKDFANHKNIVFLENVKGIRDPQLFLRDRLHLNPKGYDTVIKKILPEIVTELRKRTLLVCQNKG